jgi:hypothetical protein
MPMLQGLSINCCQCSAPVAVNALDEIIPCDHCGVRLIVVKSQPAGRQENGDESPSHPSPKEQLDSIARAYRSSRAIAAIRATQDHLHNGFWRAAIALAVIAVIAMASAGPVGWTLSGLVLLAAGMAVIVFRFADRADKSRRRRWYARHPVRIEIPPETLEKFDVGGADATSLESPIRVAINDA